MTKNYMKLVLENYAKNVPHKKTLVVFRQWEHWCAIHQPRADGSTMAIVTYRKLNTRHDFLSCLHELGHVYQGDFSLDFDNLTSNEIYKHEYTAWDWALKEFAKHTDIRPEDYDYALQSLNTYNLELQLGQRRRFSTAK